MLVNLYKKLQQLERQHINSADDFLEILKNAGIPYNQTKKHIYLDCPACEKKNKIWVNYFNTYKGKDRMDWRCMKSDCEIHKEYGDNLIGLFRLYFELSPLEAFNKICDCIQDPINLQD